MLALRSVMVVVEPSRDIQPALDAAAVWAQAARARLCALLILDPKPEADLELAPGLAEGLAKAACYEGGKWLQEQLSVLPASLEVEPVVVTGHEWSRAVIHEAERLGVDLIVTRAGAAPTASALTRVLRELPCPLLLAHGERPIGQVAAAVSVGAEDGKHKLLNDVLLEHAIRIGKLFEAHVSVLSAVPNPADFVPLMGEAYAMNYVDSELQNAYRQAVVDLAAKHGLAEGAVVTVGGQPEVVLPKLVQEREIDLLLIGTISRRAFTAWLIGNTAEEILHRVDCAVLVLRPEDYFDPVS